MRVYLADAESEQLRKYAALFMEYKNVSAWSPPEAMSSDSRKPNENSPNRVAASLKFSDHIEFYPDKRTIDIYSLGFLLWEIETERIPLEGMTQ